MNNKTTFGLIVGNRGFFPDNLVKDGREKILKFFKDHNYNIVTLSTEDTKYGGVETLSDAQKCGKLFDEKRNEIDGIIITLPNFGDEKGIANSIKFSGLNVPILVHAFPDDLSKMDLKHRRDSFCGKISVCNNLKQYGIKFSLTEFHTVHINDESFLMNIGIFAEVCKIVKGIRNARIGAIGARTGPFNTVRYSEKILEKYGISTEVIDLSEILGQTEKLKDSDVNVKNKFDKIKNYIDTKNIPEQALIKMAKFGFVVDRWIGDNNLNATAIQCWTSLENYFGIVPCSVMSLLSEELSPSACEVDVPGALSMYALQLASGKPSAIVDWNNNYKNEDDKAVIFHCSNLPKSFFKNVKMDYQEIISQTVGKENAFGTCVGKLASGNITFLRITTDDTVGKIKTYFGHGKITDDPVNSFGGYGVIEIPELEDLLDFICQNGFEHHVAINRSHVGPTLFEAFNKYLEWDVSLF